MTTYDKDYKIKAAERLRGLKYSVDPRYLIDSLGFTDPRENSKEIRSACLIHGGDNKSAFRFNKEKRSWKCFTNGCHEQHSSDVIGLIQAVLDIDFKDACKYLEELVGDVSLYSKSILETKFKQERDAFIRNNSNIKPSCVSDSNLQKYKVLRSNRFIKDGYNSKTLDHFEIAGGYVDSHGFIRDIIPIRNVDKELVAYSLKDIRDNLTREEEYYKYILTPGFDKNSILYNLNNTIIFGNKVPLIIVEGFKSVWRLYEYGIYNVVAVMGTEIMDGHKKLLKAYALKGVVLMFDGDDPGKKATERAINVLGSELKVYKVDIKEDGLDPSDLTLDQACGYLYGFI